MHPSLILEHLTLRYPGGKLAVDDVSLELGPGIVGLLGPNGAGKTSLMSILATLVRPSAGTVRWCGSDTARQPDLLRATLGYLPQHFGIYPSLSAAEFLSYLAAMKGVPAKLARARVAQCLEWVGLADVAGERLGGFSGGMRQRVGIAQALLNDPALLIVDEPTVGLDPEERLRFRMLLSELAQQRLIILSTHIVSDIEACAGRIAVMDQGRLQVHDTPDALLANARGQVWEWLVPAAQFEQVRAAYRIGSSEHCADGVRMRLVAAAAPGPGAVAVEPKLEDAYLCVLNRGQGR